MKNSNKSSLITGIILITLSALFTISLLILPFGYGFGNEDHSNIFFLVGNMIYSAYGFSSIIIPLFLLISGLSCFTSIWTSKKTMHLLTAIVPFFTAVITEKICRSILALGSDNTKIVEVIITLIIGSILIVIEYIGSGLVAEKINQKLFHSPKVKSPKLHTIPEDIEKYDVSESDDIVEEEVLSEDEKFERTLFDDDEQDKTVTNDTLNNNLDKNVEENSLNENQTIDVVEETQPVNIFEQEFQRKTETKPIETEAPKEENKETSIFDQALSKVSPTSMQEDENPKSVITVEEYAALTNPSNEDYDEDEIDELEWKNLPPEPETLPPEYIDDTNEDNYDSIDSTIEQDVEITEKTISPDFYDIDMTTEETAKDEQNFDDFDDDLDIDSQIDEYESFDEEDDDEETEIDIEKTGNTINFASTASTAFNKMYSDIENEKPATTNETSIPSTPIERPNRYGKKGPYIIPTNLLTAYKDDQYWVIDDATKQASYNLKQTLSEFNIDAQIIGIKKGPVVTMFELLPAPGVKLSKIVALQDNIALSLAASSVRIVAPIPGKQAVGIEVPNKKRSVVGFRELIEMKLPEWESMAVPVILGKDILGKAQLIDLVKTPHMLIAGATGSGKSVCVNSLILSILYKRSYRDVKLILVDPKVVELKLYNNIPHLLTPVITEPKKALQALQYCLCEMERRYALLDHMGVRDISSYNKRIKERDVATEKLPYIVVIIDEFADLMATSGKELESIVARLTAMSRAVGIHLVLATQRPSVNVITGLIKANIPSRIAFMVASRTDSNIIIDSVGAEKLLGRGDMLYASAVDPNPIRIQGTFVSDQEVEDVVNAVKEYGEPDYIDDEIFIDDDEDGSGENLDLFGNPYDEDPLYDQALEIVVQAGKASASYIQRRLKIGYNRAARLVEEMEERGIVGPANGSKPREILHIPQ